MVRDSFFYSPTYAYSYFTLPITMPADPNMEVVDYERTFEQNEELGLNDINTEEYAAPQPTGDSAEKAQSSEPCLPCGEKNAGSGDDK